MKHIVTPAETKQILDGWLSIYDLDPTINNPYAGTDQQVKSTEQWLYEHWHKVGNYLQNAMSGFHNEQTQQKQTNRPNTAKSQ